MPPIEAKNRPQPKRVIVCTHVYCNREKRAERNAEILKLRLEEINAGSEPPRVTLELSGCLSMCGAGPNWIIQPGEIICNHVDDEDEINRIVDQYLRD